MNGLIPYFKIGKAVRYRRGDILASLERMTRGGGSPSDSRSELEAMM